MEEAALYRRKHGQSFWVRWGAAAACLCLLAAGGALLIQGRGRAARILSSSNPESISQSSAAEMEAYLDFKVPVLEKEVEAYSVFISDGYPPWDRWTMRTAPSFVSSMGVETSAGIYGGTLEESRDCGRQRHAHQYDSMSCHLGSERLACSYLYTNGGDAEVDLLIQQGHKPSGK